MQRELASVDALGPGPSTGAGAGEAVAQDVTLADVAGILGRGKGRILLASVAGAALAFVVASNIPDRYEVRGLLMIDDPGAAVGAPQGARAPTVEGLSVLSVQDLLGSEEHQWGAARALLPFQPPETGLDPAAWVKAHLRRLVAVAGGWVRLDAGRPGMRAEGDPQVEALRRRIAANLTAKGSIESGMVALSYLDTEPRRAADLLNGIMDHLVVEWRERTARQRARVIASIEDRIESLRREIAARSGEVARLRQQIEMEPTPMGTVLDQRIAEATRQLAAETMALAAARARHEWTERSVRQGSIDNNGGQMPFSSLLDTLRQDRARAAQRLAALEAEVGRRHPARTALLEELRRLDGAIAAETRRMLGELRQAITAAEAREAAARDNLAALQRRSSEILPQRQLVGVQERQLASLQAAQDQLTQLLEQHRIAQQVGASAVRVVAHAVPPSLPAGPRRPLAVVLAGVVSGLGAALAALFAGTVSEFLPQAARYRGLVGARETYPLPVLPRRARQRVWRAINRRRGSVDLLARRSARDMALWLLAHRSDGGVAVTITSATPGEGKTTLSVLLAYSSAMLGARTLLVDADLFTGRVLRDLERLDLPPTEDGPGPCRIRRTPIERLSIAASDGRVQDLICTGDCRRLKQWLAELTRRFDLVVVDTPPILAGTEAISLARAGDMTVLVHDLKRGRIASLREAVNLQRMFGLGVDMLVLNRHPRHRIDLDPYRHGYRQADRARVGTPS